jgi:hypothetical protein
VLLERKNTMRRSSRDKTNAKPCHCGSDRPAFPDRTSESSFSPARLLTAPVSTTFALIMRSSSIGPSEKAPAILVSDDRSLTGDRGVYLPYLSTVSCWA